MLRMLSSLLALMVLPVVLLAQTDTKTTENTTSPNFDYKQIGAPMPPVLFMAYQSAPATAGTKKQSRRKKKKETADTGNVVSYKPITAKDLNSDANLLVMMFNPTCGHCEDVTVLLRDNIDVFKRSQVVLLANNVMRPYLPDFVERMRIGTTPHMLVAYDSSKFIDNLFLYQTLPQINIYSSERKLLKTYCGEVPIDTLKKFIQ